MRVGLLARSESRGLGHLTAEVARHLQPDRTLIIRPDAAHDAGLPMHLEPSGATVRETELAGRCVRSPGRDRPLPRGADVPKGNRAPGRSVETNRYIKLRRPGHVLANPLGWVYEHRLVAYEAGLLTDLSLMVHHIDGDKHNNDLANLEVMSRLEHVRRHRLTHCRRGHLFDDANTYWLNGKRWCRECIRFRQRKRREKLRCDSD